MSRFVAIFIKNGIFASLQVTVFGMCWNFYRYFRTASSNLIKLTHFKGFLESMTIAFDFEIWSIWSCISHRLNCYFRFFLVIVMWLACSRAGFRCFFLSYKFVVEREREREIVAYRALRNAQLFIKPIYNFAWCDVSVNFRYEIRFSAMKDGQTKAIAHSIFGLTK